MTTMTSDCGRFGIPTLEDPFMKLFELATDRVIATERASVSSGRLQHPVPAAW
ncbi:MULTISPECIES: hypothetical protein [Streptomyces]|uniref:hypothetical protein n=1 Tax=Streptomyces TaxID=1883 RepID=UPI000AEE1178|nr:hypothetical protein [Streptomyces virginiae]